MPPLHPTQQIHYEVFTPYTGRQNCKPGIWDVVMSGSWNGLAEEGWEGRDVQEWGQAVEIGNWIVGTCGEEKMERDV